MSLSEAAKLARATNVKKAGVTKLAKKQKEESDSDDEITMVPVNEITALTLQV